MIAQRIFVGIALAAVLSGCGDEAPARPEPEAPISAADALAAGAQAVASTSYRFSVMVEGPIRIAIDGRFDPTSQSMMSSMRALRREDPSQRVESESVAVGADSWTRTAEGEVIPDDQDWIYVDLSANPYLQALTYDPASIGVLAAAVSKVEYGDDVQRLKGTVDLSRLEHLAGLSDQIDLSEMSTLPFTARLDSQDRLDQFVVDLNPGATSDKAHTITVELRRFGVEVVVDTPSHAN